MAKKSKIRNFDDLGQDEQFTFGGKTYTIPAISQATSEALAEIGQEMRDSIAKEDYVTANKKTFEYVAASMAGSHTEAELAKLPKQVISAIMKIVAEEMLGVASPEEMTDSEEQSEKK